MKYVSSTQHDAPENYGRVTGEMLTYRSKFEVELCVLLNKHGVDADLEMADFVLARMMVAQLAVIEIAQARQVAQLLDGHMRESAKSQTPAYAPKPRQGKPIFK